MLRTNGRRPDSSAFPTAAQRPWDHRNVDAPDAAQWWADLRRSWEFTPTSEGQKQCQLGGRTLASTAVGLLARRQWHQDKGRHPSAQ